MSASATSIRDITVIVDLQGNQRAATIAAELARKTGAHLTGISVAFDPLVPVYTVAAPIPTDFIVSAREQAIADAKKAAADFSAIGTKAGIGAESRVVESIAGDGFATLVRNCILTDLAVIGQDNPDQTEPMREALIEALLFQAGLPTLIIPYAGVTDFVSDRALVAWNGSAAAGRAVRAAMPMLAMAKHVLVAIVDEDGRGESGADIGAYLARHDLDVTVRVIPGDKGGAGPALLSLAADEGSNWMVMGAYGHSRLREFLLGGVTRTVLGSTTLPTLMSH